VSERQGFIANQLLLSLTSSLSLLGLELGCTCNGHECHPQEAVHDYYHHYYNRVNGVGIEAMTVPEGGFKA
jgi:hypothetical protein